MRSLTTLGWPLTFLAGINVRQQTSKLVKKVPRYGPGDFVNSLSFHHIVQAGCPRYSSTHIRAKPSMYPIKPRPGSSIILISPRNQVLLLHRVNTSTSFPSAHVFPGGNTSNFQDGNHFFRGHRLHEDSMVYRHAAIRETFEESGILLARDSGGSLLNIPVAERDKVRRAVHANEIHFGDWLASVGAVPDIENLLPFTRWLTPASRIAERRFSTQFYLYMLPQETSSDPALSALQNEAQFPTPDDGFEITSAEFDDVVTWLKKEARGEVMLFPPQYFLLYVLSTYLRGAPADGDLDSEEMRSHYEGQREELLTFYKTTPTTMRRLPHRTALIPWAQKVICPQIIESFEKEGVGRVWKLALEHPGPELKTTDRGGDERVMMIRFTPEGPRDLEVLFQSDSYGKDSPQGAKSDVQAKY
ncbi:hypothetical protein F4808DRAFT_352160 [Astrocystis sublimbata]|nr:hypothetical protein F4808DRAFT_352160 [Astrocystis sublimbata]